MAIVKCDFERCMYNKESKCVLREVEIDALTMCASYCVITQPEDWVARERERITRPSS